MKAFKYSKKTIRFNLIFGIIWILFAVFNYLSVEKFGFGVYAYSIIGTLYIGKYFKMKNSAYLTIDSSSIIKPDFFKKEIKVSKLKQIKEFTDQVTFTSTENKNIKVSKNQIKKEQVSLFEAKIGTLREQIENKERSKTESCFN